MAVPTIGIAGPAAGGPLDAALRRLPTYDWVIVTSANGARACLRRAAALHIDLVTAGRSRARWAAVGPATAAALREGGVPVAMVPRRYLTEAIARELKTVSGRHLLLPRTAAAGPALAEALRARGADVDEIIAYRTVIAPARLASRIRRVITRRLVDTIVFTSASTVHGFIQLLGESQQAVPPMTVACIGPVTAAAARERGLRPAIVAGEHTIEGLLEALVAHARRSPASKGAQHARDRASR